MVECVFVNDVPFHLSDVQFFFDNTQQEDIRIYFRSVQNLVGEGIADNKPISAAARRLDDEEGLACFEVVIDKDIAYGTLEILYHELTHIQQMCAGKLSFKYKRGKWQHYWDGEHIKLSDPPTHEEYWNMPSEVEARELGKELADKRQVEKWEAKGISPVLANAALTFL